MRVLPCILSLMSLMKACVCVFVFVPHPRLFTGRVSFGIAENEPDVFAELNWRLVLSLC